MTQTNEGFFVSMSPVIDELMSMKPQCFEPNEYSLAIKYTLLAYAEESPLHTRYNNIEQKREYSEEYLGCRDRVDDDAGSMYMQVLEVYLTRFVHSYRYEFLVTCHILLADNNRELRKPIVHITDEDKRAKTASTRSELLKTNREIIDMIDSLNKAIFSQSVELAEKYASKRLSIEERIQQSK